MFVDGRINNSTTLSFLKDVRKFYELCLQRLVQHTNGGPFLLLTTAEIPHQSLLSVFLNSVFIVSLFK